MNQTGQTEFDHDQPHGFEPTAADCCALPLELGEKWSHLERRRRRLFWIGGGLFAASLPWGLASSAPCLAGFMGMMVGASAAALQGWNVGRGKRWFALFLFLTLGFVWVCLSMASILNVPAITAGSKYPALRIADLTIGTLILGSFGTVTWGAVRFSPRSAFGDRE